MICTPFEVQNFVSAAICGHFVAALDDEEVNFNRMKKNERKIFRTERSHSVLKSCQSEQCLQLYKKSRVDDHRLLKDESQRNCYEKFALNCSICVK